MMCEHTPPHPPGCTVSLQPPDVPLETVGKSMVPKSQRQNRRPEKFLDFPKSLTQSPVIECPLSATHCSSFGGHSNEQGGACASKDTCTGAVRMMGVRQLSGHPYALVNTLTIEGAQSKTWMQGKPARCRGSLEKGQAPGDRDVSN